MMGRKVAIKIINREKLSESVLMKVSGSNLVKGNRMKIACRDEVRSTAQVIVTSSKLKQILKK